MSFLLAEHRVLQSALASNIINTLGRFVMKAFKQDASHSVATLTCFIYGQVKSLWLYIAFEMTRSPLWSYIPDWPLWFQRVLAATHSTVVVRSVALSRKHLEGGKKNTCVVLFSIVYIIKYYRRTLWETLQLFFPVYLPTTLRQHKVGLQKHTGSCIYHEYNIRWYLLL